jgi:hypothetical protein
MKKIRKILNSAEPLALVALAAVIILLLMRMQPGVKGGRSQQPGATNSRPDAGRMLTEMRAEALLPLLQRIMQRNTGVFTMNAADTSGKILKLQITDEAAAGTVLFGDRKLTGDELSLLKNNGVRISSTVVELPLQRQNGVLMVKVPAVMAFAMAGG